MTEEEILKELNSEQPKISGEKPVIKAYEPTLKDRAVQALTTEYGLAFGALPAFIADRPVSRLFRKSVGLPSNKLFDYKQDIEDPLKYGKPVTQPAEYLVRAGLTPFQARMIEAPVAMLSPSATFSAIGKATAPAQRLAGKKLYEAGIKVPKSEFEHTFRNADPSIPFPTQEFLDQGITGGIQGQAEKIAAWKKELDKQVSQDVKKITQPQSTARLEQKLKNIETLGELKDNVVIPSDMRVAQEIEGLKEQGSLISGEELLARKQRYYQWYTDAQKMGDSKLVKATKNLYQSASDQLDTALKEVTGSEKSARNMKLQSTLLAVEGPTANAAKAQKKNPIYLAYPDFESLGGATIAGLSGVALGATQADTAAQELGALAALGYLGGKAYKSPYLRTKIGSKMTKAPFTGKTLFNLGPRQYLTPINTTETSPQGITEEEILQELAK